MGQEDRARRAPGAQAATEHVGGDAGEGAEDLAAPHGPGDGRADARPLHVRIRSALERRLAAGAYAVGCLLPTEVELAREFDTSRFTIREALRYLQERGYVERRQGVGTRVVSITPRVTYTLSVGSLDELFLLEGQTRLVLLSEAEVVLDVSRAALVDAVPGTRWIHLEGLRRPISGGPALCCAEAFLPARFAPLLPRLRRHDGPLFAFLENHCAHPIELAVQELAALPMPARVAERLAQPVGAPALRVLRRYVTAEGVLLTSLVWHPAGSIVCRMELRRALSADGPPPAAPG